MIPFRLQCRLNGRTVFWYPTSPRRWVLVEFQEGKEDEYRVVGKWPA